MFALGLNLYGISMRVPPFKNIMLLLQVMNRTQVRSDMV